MDIYPNIISDIQSKYKSLDDPDFSFISRASNDNLYGQTIEDISRIYLVEETTDLNVDVSFQFILKREYELWNLQLSMIGKYAVLLEIMKPGVEIKLIEPNIFSVEAMKILDVLQSQEIVLLGSNVLNQPIHIKLFATEPENTRVYQALFGDYDILPWQQYSTDEDRSAARTQ